MKLALKLFLNSIAIIVLAKILDGVHVASYLTAIIIAFVLSVLNLLIKPVLIILTLPITILTLGLFLFVVNALIILLASKLISGFEVFDFWTAILFSILLSVLQSLLHSLLKKDLK